VDGQVRPFDSPASQPAYNILSDIGLSSVLLRAIAVTAVNLGHRCSERFRIGRNGGPHHDFSGETSLDGLESSVLYMFSLVIRPTRPSAEDNMDVRVALKEDNQPAGECNRRWTAQWSQQYC